MPPAGPGEGVAARGLGACVWARAPKPEQTLSLQGSRYVDPSAFPAVFRRPVRGRNGAVGVRSI